MARSNALQTLWGSGDPERDRSRKNTAKSMISPGTRPQEIYTPQIVLDVVAEVWPEGIALDPCAGPDSLVQAFDEYCGGLHTDGLVAPWANRTYFNPPYKDLKAWLFKAAVESTKGHEIIGLFPVRTHRRWWREIIFEADAISWMDPLKFKGYLQAFPAPLCLVYWGKRTVQFNNAQKRLSRD